jgi:hypothetical protein
VFLAADTGLFFSYLRANDAAISDYARIVLFGLFPGRARTCFDLSRRQVTQLPFMLSTPGLYGEGRPNSRKRCLRLLSVKAEKQLSLELHGGSLENIKNALIFSCGNFSADYELSLCSWLLDAPLEPLEQNPSQVTAGPRAMSEHHCGMASVLFPSVSPNRQVDPGLWFRGCERTNT